MSKDTEGNNSSTPFSIFAYFPRRFNNTSSRSNSSNSSNSNHSNHHSDENNNNNINSNDIEQGTTMHSQNLSSSDEETTNTTPEEFLRQIFRRPALPELQQQSQGPQTGNVSDRSPQFDSSSQQGTNYSTDSTWHSGSRSPSSSVFLSSKQSGSFEEHSYSTEGSQPPASSARFESLLSSFDETEEIVAQPLTRDDPMLGVAVNSSGNIETAPQMKPVLQQQVEAQTTSVEKSASDRSSAYQNSGSNISDDRCASSSSYYSSESSEQLSRIEEEVDAGDQTNSSISFQGDASTEDNNQESDGDGPVVVPQGVDDSFLSGNELNELDKLIGMASQGKECDQDRLYELSLVYRWMQNETLDMNERSDLDYYRTRRRKDKRLKREFRYLVEQSQAGVSIDEDRFYCLQLYCRFSVGEVLTGEERAHLENFEIKERRREGEIVSSETIEVSSGSHATESEQGGNRNDNLSESYEQEASDSDSSDLSMEVVSLSDESAVMAEVDATLPSPDDSSDIHDLPRNDRTPEMSERSENDGDNANDFPLVVEEANYRREMELSGHNRGSTTGTQSASQNTRPIQSEITSFSPDTIDSSDKSVEILDASSPGHENGPSSTPESNQDLDDSFLSRNELDELDKLIEMTAQGKECNRDRLYELSLIYRWMQNEQLDMNEVNDVDYFRKRRRKDKRLKREFQNLITQSQAGVSIDEDRLYCLQLYGRFSMGEVLTIEEMARLEDFEIKERRREVEDDSSDMIEASSGSHATESEQGGNRNDNLSESNEQEASDSDSSDLSMEVVSLSDESAVMAEVDATLPSPDDPSNINEGSGNDQAPETSGRSKNDGEIRNKSEGLNTLGDTGEEDSFVHKSKRISQEETNIGSEEEQGEFSGDDAEGGIQNNDSRSQAQPASPPDGDTEDVFSVPMDVESETAQGNTEMASNSRSFGGDRLLHDELDIVQSPATFGDAEDKISVTEEEELQTESLATVSDGSSVPTRSSGDRGSETLPNAESESFEAARQVNDLASSDPGDSGWSTSLLSKSTRDEEELGPHSLSDSSWREISPEQATSVPSAIHTLPESVTFNADNYTAIRSSKLTNFEEEMNVSEKDGDIKPDEDSANVGIFHADGGGNASESDAGITPGEFSASADSLYADGKDKKVDISDVSQVKKDRNEAGFDGGNRGRSNEDSKPTLFEIIESTGRIDTDTTTMAPPVSASISSANSDTPPLLFIDSSSPEDDAVPPTQAQSTVDIDYTPTHLTFDSAKLQSNSDQVSTAREEGKVAGYHSTPSSATSQKDLQKSSDETDSDAVSESHLNHSEEASWYGVRKHNDIILSAVADGSDNLESHRVATDTPDSTATSALGSVPLSTSDPCDRNESIGSSDSYTDVSVSKSVLLTSYESASSHSESNRSTNGSDAGRLEASSSLAAPGDHGGDEADHNESASDHPTFSSLLESDASDAKTLHDTGDANTTFSGANSGREEAPFAAATAAAAPGDGGGDDGNDNASVFDYPSTESSHQGLSASDCGSFEDAAAIPTSDAQSHEAIFKIIKEKQLLSTEDTFGQHVKGQSIETEHSQKEEYEHAVAGNDEPQDAPLSKEIQSSSINSCNVCTEEAGSAIKTSHMTPTDERYRKEFQELLAKDERGEHVDEERMYHLELYARRYLGEMLDEDEIMDLTEFIEEEETALGDSSMALDRAERVPEKEAGLNLATNQMDSFVTTMEEDKSREVGKDNENTKSYPPRDTKSNLSNCSEVVSSHGNSTSSDDSDCKTNVESSVRSNTASIAQASSSPRADDMVILSESEMDELNHMLDLLARGEEYDQVRVYELGLIYRWMRGETLDIEETRDFEVFKKLRSKEASHKLLTASSPDKSTQEGHSQSSSPRASQNANDGSFLSQTEIYELNELLELVGQGKEYNQDRLYELGLMYRWMRGEGIDAEESRDLESFRKLRRKDRAFKREFQEIIKNVEKGEEVDKHRFYCLELYGRRSMGEDLTEEELCRVQEFERDEETRVYEETAASSPSHSFLVAVKSGGPEQKVPYEDIISQDDIDISVTRSVIFPVSSFSLAGSTPTSSVTASYALGQDDSSIERLSLAELSKSPEFTKKNEIPKAKKKRSKDPPPKSPWRRPSENDMENELLEFLGRKPLDELAALGPPLQLQPLDPPLQSPVRRGSEQSANKEYTGQSDSSTRDSKIERVELDEGNLPSRKISQDLFDRSRDEIKDSYRIQYAESKKNHASIQSSNVSSEIIEDSFVKNSDKWASKESLDRSGSLSMRDVFPEQLRNKSQESDSILQSASLSDMRYEVDATKKSNASSKMSVLSPRTTSLQRANQSLSRSIDLKAPYTSSSQTSQSKSQHGRSKASTSLSNRKHTSSRVAHSATPSRRSSESNRENNNASPSRQLSGRSPSIGHKSVITLRQSEQSSLIPEGQTSASSSRHSESSRSRPSQQTRSRSTSMKEHPKESPSSISDRKTKKSSNRHASSSASRRRSSKSIKSKSGSQTSRKKPNSVSKYLPSTNQPSMKGHSRAQASPSKNHSSSSRRSRSSPHAQGPRKRSSNYPQSNGKRFDQRQKTRKAPQAKTPDDRQEHMSVTSAGQSSSENHSVLDERKSSSSGSRSTRYLSQLADELEHEVLDPVTESVSTKGMSIPNSRSMAFLKESAVNLSSKREKVHCSIRNEGYLMAVDMAYKDLLKCRPRLQYLLSLAEWRHVHVLMLYARLFNCELAATKIDQPKDFNIYIPEDLKVFDPFGVVLGSLGIVEDPALGVAYIPVAKPVRDGKAYVPHDPEDVTIFMEWSQYKWNASWAQVEIEREARKQHARAKGIELPNEAFAPNYSKLHAWEHLALEIWLGWDEELWFAYKMAAQALSKTYSFIPFPRKTTGSYSWLIPRHENDSGVYGRVPKPSITSEVWMIALLFNLCDLPPGSTGSWYYKTKVIKDKDHILHQFLDSGRI